MRQLTAQETFRPLDVGVSPVWGFIIEGASGTSTLQIRAAGAWRPVATFAESGTFVDELRRDATYKFSAINADAVTVI